MTGRWRFGSDGVQSVPEKSRLTWLQLRLADALRLNQRGTLEERRVAEVDLLEKKEAKVIRSRRYGSGTPTTACNFKLRGAAITPGENTPARGSHSQLLCNMTLS